MKTTVMSLLASATAIAIGITAVPAQAQFNGFETNGQWQEKQQQLIETLGLTATQVSQLEALRADMRSQLAGTFTAEQRATLQSALSSGQDLRTAMQSLNLTEAQRQTIQTAMRSFRAEASTVLTPAQRQQMRQLVQERRGNRLGR